MATKSSKIHDIEGFPDRNVIVPSPASSRLCGLLRSRDADSSRWSEKEKAAWIRSELIGEDVEVETPFGRRQLTYADHTATGRCLLCVENYIVRQVLPFYGNTHTSDSFVGEKTTRMAEEAKLYIKRCVKAGPSDAVIFCGSGATAAVKRLQEVMGIAAAGDLRERVVLREEERWAVFVGPWEHHSNILSWRQTTAEVVEVGVDARSGSLDMEGLEAELGRMKRGGRRMLGSFSACSNVTGVICDTRSLARLLHRYGAFACFDFATSGPHVQIEMGSREETGKYDAVFLSPHKFVGGPGTPGILVMAKALYQLDSSPPSTCGGGVVDYVNGFSPNDTVYVGDVEEREDAGTPPIIQKIRAALAFRVKEIVGYDLIDRNETFFIETAIKRLRPNPSVHLLGNLEPKRLAVLSFLIFPAQNVAADESSIKQGPSSSAKISDGSPEGKPLSGRFVAKLLNDLFGIQARGGCSCAGPYGHILLGVDQSFSLGIRSLILKGYKGLKPGWTRVSFSFYMTEPEFEFILSAIEFVAAYGHRFLPVYDFDWATGDWRHDGMPPLSPIEARAGRRRGRMDAKTFEKYLKTATKVALSLEKKPRPRRIPQGVDPKLIYFRI